MESRKRDCYNLQLPYQNRAGMAMAETLFPLRAVYVLIQLFVLDRHDYLDNSSRDY